jgi:8-oxo-dGTP diphosphatase
MQERPKVGVGVCIFKENQVLMGLRKNAHGAQTWAFPGGHLEFGETVQECARREVLEETGLQLGIVKPGPYSQDIFIAENKHYITLIMIGEYIGGQPLILEPHKCQEWRWFDWGQWPENLFLTNQNLMRNGIDLRNYQ